MKITTHVSRKTDQGCVRWSWSLVGYGDAVTGEERTRRSALVMARRCQRSNLNYYFKHIRPHR